MANDELPVRPWRRFLRYGILIGAGAVLGWFAFAVSADNVLGAKHAALGTGSDPVKATQAAELLVRRPGREQIAQAQRLAEAAVRASPVNVRAIWALGSIAALRNDERTAQRLFAYAETLSRRDLPTQLWLIESAVQHNDVPTALLHYDRALRSNIEAQAILFPVLMGAASQPQIAGPLARLLATRPEWWSVFATAMIATPSSSSPALAFLLGQVRLNLADPVERPLALSAVLRLVNDGEYARAYQLYRSVTRSGARRPGVNDGGFDAVPAVPPFDWTFVEEMDLSASREASGDGYVLRLHSSQGRAGIVARQLLVLPAGRYRLSFTAGDVSATALARPSVTLSCANDNARQLVRTNAPAARVAGQAAANFSIPSEGCTAQWLSINVNTAADEQTIEPWIDQISIVPSTDAGAGAPGA
jgi:hypothetical protein